MKIKLSRFSSLLLISGISLGLAGATVHAEEGSTNSSSDPTHRFSLLVMGDFYTPSLDSSNSNFSSLTNSANLGAGLGVLSESTLAGPISWEYGLMFFSRQSTHKNAIVSFTESSQWLSLPVGLKVRFAKYFAVGAGGYLNYRLGEVTNKFSVGDNSLVSFDTDSRSRFEGGIYGTAGATLPITPNLGIVGEVRVMRGLSNLYKDSTADLKSVDILTMAGIQFSY